jgi:hypothetical protein
MQNEILRKTINCIEKGVSHEIFDFRIFSRISFPLPPEYLMGSFRIFMKIRGRIRKFVFSAGVNETGNKLFSGVNDTGDILSSVSLTPVINLYFRISPRIFKEIRNGPTVIVYSGARGKLLHEKNVKSKISCQNPFKNPWTR